MEFANSIIFIKPYIPSGTPLLSPKFPIYTWKNNSRLTISTSRKLHLRPSFALYSFDPLPSKKFRISTRFSRPTNRQNHLRKKLTQQQQFQQVRTLRNPILKFDRIDGSESNTDKADGESENFDNRVSLDNEYDFDGSREESRNAANNHEESGNGVEELEIELPKKPFGESINWNKLEGWVEQYKKDSEFWGVGTDPIFTITQDSKGKVEKVVLNEDEIRRRSQIEPQLDSEAEAFAEVDFKISFAKELAREMESGINVIPKNSTVAKFVSSGEVSAFTNTIQVVKSKPGLFSRMSKVGFFLLCGLLVAKAIRGFFDNKKKMEAITEKEKAVKGNVEVLDDPIESKISSFRRPQLNKEELVNSINQMKGPKGMVEYSGYEDKEFKDKIEKIRAMARNAREIEKINSLWDDELEDEPLKEFPNGNLRPKNVVKRNEVLVGDSDENTEFTSITILENDIGQFSEVSVEKNTETCDISNAVTPNGSASLISEVGNTNPVNNSSDLNEADLYSDGPACRSENSPKMKFRIMKSVEEAREYLSRNHQKVENNIECEIKDEQADTSKTGDILDVTNQENDSTILSDLPYPSENFHVDGETTEENMYNLNKETMLLMLERPGEVDKETSDIHNDSEIVIQKAVSAPPGKHNSEDDEENETLTGHQAPGTSGGNEVIGRNAEQAPSESKENWIEKNFHEFEPIVKRIGAGFQDNYHVARQKANEELDFKVDMEQLKSASDESEFEWMKDEKLREIVFRVRDNELSGRDPFHLMDEEDKQAFFSGLEKKVEQENEKLQSLHKYFHSNIENLDYGADGISLYDPPEKIIPRWKAPPAEKNPEFLNNFSEQKEAHVAEGLKNSFFTKGTGNKIVNKSEESSSHKNAHLAADVLDQNTELQRKRPVSSKTVIEGSDGSSKAGKKSGKEFWQHTKKWSQGFMDSYNAETDPEVKSVMKDIGKDLDRWITEKEIQEAAELMDKLPEKGQKFIKAKLDKVKREMELFGPQAVVSKYKEYAEEKEEDYLWWLDLPIVLCIELYTIEENGEQKVGFYSLEMAADLELDPKQYHVVAFEDAGDCKNLCYIIQAHMELLGNGNAFVVARPPKDAFREAKENGFSITVIRKGQLQLNIDQTLEEVEELIQEIGSKIYHDKLMKEHGMDVNTLMKGVFGISKPTNRNKKSRRKLKRPANQ